METEAANKKTVEKLSLFKYDKDDCGPFHVYIEHADKNFGARLNAMKIGETLLLTHPELDNKINNIESVGRNRIRVNCKDAVSANALAGSVLLKKHNLDAYIPKFLLFSI